MISYQKNTLLGLLAQFSAKLYETRNDIDDKTNALGLAGKFSEASAHSNIWPTIERNLTSIEKQLKKL